MPPAEWRHPLSPSSRISDPKQQRLSRSSFIKDTSSWRRHVPIAVVTVTLIASVMTGSPAFATPADCVPSPGGAVLVPPDCNDPLYATPVIDSESDESVPVTHHKV